MDKSKNDTPNQLATELGKLIAGSVLYNEYVASRVGMSSSEMQSIHLLQLNGPLTPGELASSTGLQSGSMTAVLDRLEKLKFVKRQPHPHDRRKVIVTTNEKQITAKLAPYYNDKAAHAQEVMRVFTAEELEIVTRFLRVLNS
jgi:DNA-binding MarR family transcriptional regulator